MTSPEPDGLDVLDAILDDPDACDQCASRDPYQCNDGCDCPDCTDGEDREP